MMKKYLLLLAFFSVCLAVSAQVLIPDFTMSATSICAGQSVTFTNTSTAISTPPINSWNWNFDFTSIGGASPSTANTVGPHSVTFNNPGTYVIRLTVSNGTLTESTNKILNVSVGNTLPISQNFEGTFPSGGWSVSNQNNSPTQNWEVNTTVGFSSSRSLWRNLCSSSIGTNALFLNFPRVNLVGVTAAAVEFRLAYRGWSTTSFATLTLQASTNCGATYTDVWTQSGEQLSTVTPWFSTTCLTPTAGDWALRIIDISSLSGNAAVDFRLRLTDVFSNNIYIDDVSVKGYTTPPNAPTSLTATAPFFNQVNLSWTDNDTGEQGFRVERSTDNFATFTVLANDLPPNTTSYIDNTVAPSTTYQYRVRAFFLSLNSPYSNVATVTTPAVSLNAPTSLTATAVSATRINLAWTDAEINEAGYKVERSTDGVNFTEIASGLSANSTSYSDNGLSAGTQYFYRVRCFLGTTNSPYSNVADATTFIVIPAPTTLVATAASASQINLTWNDVATNEAGYKVERSPNGINFTEIADLPANSSTYSNIGLASGILYFYRVRAYNGSIFSSYSNVAQATTQVTINAPTNLVANAISPFQIDVTWNDNATNEAGYRLERSLNGTDFQVISGTGLPPNSTIFSDAPLSQNTTYFYRVAAFNGPFISSAYSNVAQATTPLATALENSLNEAIKVFPNPSKGNIFVSLADASIYNSKIEVYNTIGTKVLEKQQENETQILLDLSHSPKGVYFVRIISDKGRFYKKVVVQ
jgi:PKD repeat protein